jgi:hypothetical protein
VRFHETHGIVISKKLADERNVRQRTQNRVANAELDNKRNIAASTLGRGLGSGTRYAMLF